MKTLHFAAALAGLALATAGASTVGCSAIAGVDFDSAREVEGGLLASADAGDEDPGVIAVPDASSGAGCTATQKLCNGACVSKTDPAYGCDSTDCVPCSVPFAKAAACKAGKCAAGDCQEGRLDCDGDTSNGCEADKTSPMSCGTCTTKCTGAALLCAATGCLSACPAGTMQCGSSCVDTTKSLDHCGGCGTKCNAPANGDPLCASSTCTFSCRTGFGDCTNNPAKACNVLPKWYADADNDGVGTASSVQSCTKPAGHAAASGDCLDTNPQVFPGQPMSFGTSFISAAGAESFDYDCSGVEVEEFGEHWPGACGAGCDAFGYTPRIPARSGAGVNGYCGSTTTRQCIDDGPIQQILQSTKPMRLPIGGCRAFANSGPPVRCK